jgi:hypothetical protein
MAFQYCELLLTSSSFDAWWGGLHHVPVRSFSFPVTLHWFRMMFHYTGMASIIMTISPFLINSHPKVTGASVPFRKEMVSVAIYYHYSLSKQAFSPFGCSRGYATLN